MPLFEPRVPRKLFVAISSVNYGNSTTQTSLIGTGAAGSSKTLWENIFSQPGTILRIRASGGRTANLSTDINCELSLKKGSTVLWSAGNPGLAKIADKYPWLLDVAIIGRSATTVSASGALWMPGADGTTVRTTYPVQMPTQPITISASAEDIDFTAQYGSGVGAGDYLDCHDFIMTLE